MVLEDGDCDDENDQVHPSAVEVVIQRQRL